MGRMTISVLVHVETTQVVRDIVVRTDNDGNPIVPVGWLVDPDLSAVQGVDEKYWKVVNDGVVAMDASEQGAINARELERAKEKKISAIRLKTTRMVEAGFQHGGKTIILNESDLLQLVILANADQSSFKPIVWPTKDGSFVEIDTMGEFTTFFRKASGLAFTMYGDARALEESVRSAADIAAVNAIQDNR